MLQVAVVVSNSHASVGQLACAVTTSTGADRLNSWKEIARYLEREVRTVQLWEKFEGLPIHRHFHSRQGTIFAFRSEIECWRRTRIIDRQSVGPGPVGPKIKIMPVTNALPDCALSDLINDTVEMLSLAEFDIVSDIESLCSDYVVRLSSDFEANCIVVDVIFSDSREVVWSRSLNGGTSSSAVARSIALLSRTPSLGSIWNPDRLPDTAAVHSKSPTECAPVPEECVDKVRACGAVDQCQARTWPCLSRGAACGFCRCHLW